MHGGHANVEAEDVPTVTHAGFRVRSKTVGDSAGRWFIYYTFIYIHSYIHMDGLNKKKKNF